MLIYFSMLDLPKAIINEAIQGKRFPTEDTTVAFLKIHLTLPQFLGGAVAGAVRRLRAAPAALPVRADDRRSSR